MCSGHCRESPAEICVSEGETLPGPHDACEEAGPQVQESARWALQSCEHARVPLSVTALPQAAAFTFFPTRMELTSAETPQ